MTKQEMRALIATIMETVNVDFTSVVANNAKKILMSDSKFKNTTKAQMQEIIDELNTLDERKGQIKIKQVEGARLLVNALRGRELDIDVYNSTTNDSIQVSEILDIDKNSGFSLGADTMLDSIVSVTFNRKISENQVNGKYITRKPRKDEEGNVIKGEFDYSIDIETDEVDPDTGKNIWVTEELEVTEKEYAKSHYHLQEGSEPNEEIPLIEVRTALYKDGFTINGQKYVEYQRSGGSAREGNCLFMKKEIYAHMMYFSNMGLNLDKEVEVTSVRAYQALTLSEKQGQFSLANNEILLVEDLQEVAKGLPVSYVSAPTEDQEKKTYYFNGTKVTLKLAMDKGYTTVEEFIEDYEDDIEVRVETVNVENLLTVERRTDIELSNEIWDGQSLLDESVFKEVGTQDKGMLLTRNHFFKSAMFNTKIQKYVKHHGITEVTDMFGNVLDATKIKLITTPNSLKALSLVKNHPIETYEGKIIKTKLDMYRYWLDKRTYFGIVKTEKGSNIKGFRQVSYQMLNTLPLTKEEVKSLMRYTLEHLDNLKNNIACVRHEQGQHEFDSNVGFVRALLSFDDGIKDTKSYKNGLKALLQDAVKRIKRGTIKIKGDYFTLFNQGYEMLQYAFSSAEVKQGTKELSEIPSIVSPLAKGNVYAKGIKKGRLVGMRNPHLDKSSVDGFENVDCDVYKLWFNIGNHIVATRFGGTATTYKLGGADFDSDTMILSEEEELVMAELRLRASGVPVVSHNIKGIKIIQDLTPETKAIADNQIANNQIGVICNLAQVYNAFDLNTTDEKVRKNCEDANAILNVLSQLEIDSAKVATDVKVSSVMDYVKKNFILDYDGNKTYGANSNIKKDNALTEEELAQATLVLPSFFNNMFSDETVKSNKNSNKVYVDTFNSPMQHIDTIMQEYNKNKKSTKTVKMFDFFGYTKREASKMRAYTVKDERNLIRDCAKLLAGQLSGYTRYASMNNVNAQAKSVAYKEIFERTTKELNELKPSLATLRYMFINASDDYKDCEKALLRILFKKFGTEMEIITKEVRTEGKRTKMVTKDKVTQDMEIVGILTQYEEVFAVVKY